MRRLQTQARALSERLARLALDSTPVDAELDDLRDQKGTAERNMAEFADFRAFQGYAREAEDELEELEFRQEALRACSPACPADVKAELDDIAASIALLTAQHSQFQNTATDRERRYRAAEAERDRLEAAIADQQAALDSQRASIQMLREQLIAQYSSYAQLEGGAAELTYDSHWDEALAQLRNTNPRTWWEKIPTQAARVYASLVPGIGQDSYLATLPSVLGYRVNDAEVLADGIVKELPTYPETVKVQVTLSLVGACVAHEPSAYDIETTSAGLPLFAMTIGYEFPTVSEQQVNVGYNLYSLYRLLPRDRALYDADSDWLIARAKASSAVAFAWPANTVLTQAHQTFERNVVWQLMQRVRARVARPLYDDTLVGPYRGPPAPVGVLLRAPARASRLESVSRASRHEGLLQKVSALVTARAPLDQPTQPAPDTLLAKTALMTARAAELSHVRTAMKLTKEQTRSIAPAEVAGVVAAFKASRRASDPLCGWFHLDCAGLSWRVPSGLSEAAVRAQLDHPETAAFDRRTTTCHVAATVFNPSASGVVLGGDGNRTPPPVPLPTATPPARPPIAPVPRRPVERRCPANVNRCVEP